MIKTSIHIGYVFIMLKTAFFLDGGLFGNPISVNTTRRNLKFIPTYRAPLKWQETEKTYLKWYTV